MILEESSWEIGSGKTYSELTGNIHADVAIIGGGIAGIFNAYILSKAGIKVVVLEKDKNLLQQTTMMTTAFITKLLDSSFDELITLFGDTRARLIWQSGQDAIDLVANIVKEENIDCDFQSVSAYTYAKDEKQFGILSLEYEAIKKSGFDAILRENNNGLNFKNSGCMQIPGQAKFHPIKFAQSLALKAESLGAKFFTNSEVISIEGNIVKTKTGQVEARDIVIATYAPFTNEGTRFKKAMYQSYVYELEIAKGFISEGLYLDMNNPYHYFRIDSFGDFDRMIVGGEDHRKDVKVNPEKNFMALEGYVKTVLGNNSYKITRKWYGPILESVDGLALIGKIKPHTYVATGFSGNGMSYSAISATIIRDSILGRDNAFASIYDPKRKQTFKQLNTKGLDYIHEFFGGAFKNFFSKKA